MTRSLNTAVHGITGSFAALTLVAGAAPALAQDARADRVRTFHSYFPAAEQSSPDNEAEFAELDRRGEAAREKRADGDVHDEYDLTVEQRRELDRRGRDARARRNPEGIRGPDFNGEAYRRHAARLAYTADLRDLEERGYRERRRRPGRSEIHDEYDLTPGERLDLDRRGRVAQRHRRDSAMPAGVGAARLRGDVPAIATGARTGPAPRSARLRSSGAGGLAQAAARKAEIVDIASEAIGGHSTGIGEYAGDMTVGQLETFANGDDPILAVQDATTRLGQNLEGAANGVADSIRDPRRIPNNMANAATGAIEGGVGLIDQTARTGVRTVRDTGRFITDREYARRTTQRSVRAVGRTVENVGKSTCKGVATLLGMNSRKCR